MCLHLCFAASVERTKARARIGEEDLKLRLSTGLRIVNELDRHWLRWALLFWVGIVAVYLWQRWPNIYWLALTDTDDNMRLAQVRAWMAGQGWYDLRQYRLDPPAGFDIHWSRLVDLPIAGLILLFKPFVGTAMAERLACGIAPMLPLGVTILALSVTVRRLVAPLAWPLAIVLLLTTSSTMAMFAPMRIDHHGWQLAFLALTLTGLSDPRSVRGGAIVGLSSAASMTIGMELLPYCAMAGAIVALRWVWDGAEARRMQVYGLTLGGGTAFGFLVFASYANQAMRCDALTPVWLSVMVVAGALLFLLSLVPARRRWVRLALAAVAGAVIAAGFAYSFPQCLGRLEGVSPELQRVWLDNVREARPIYRHPWRTGMVIATLPVIGLIGAIVATWVARRSRRFVGWVAVTLFTAFAVAMLLWQVRAAPAAQLLGVAGATALAWAVLPWFLTRRSVLVRVLGTVLAFVLLSGVFVGLTLRLVPADKKAARPVAVTRANASCARTTSLAPLDRIDAATMFTHVDFGPRVIVVTHHNAVAGPYHRNGQAILDVHRAFTGPTANFPAIAAAHHARYVLLCPNLSETTLYRARNPNGFYARLARGEVPWWLTAVPMPDGSPLRLYRINPAVLRTPALARQVSAPEEFVSGE